ncbi:hypothetical protein GALL_437400 [mine drainage metagenome]|uniref:Uncharacterized protein n=1 Tax=mine drainage metagenome TaxID=410659 RepID=A0A1J5QF48_9ZZZZ
MFRVVNRDVLEHRRLAEAHEEPQHEQRDDEGHEVHLRRKRDRASLPLNNIVRRRIGQHEQQDGGEAEAPVHHRPRAEPVGQVAAIGAEQRGRQPERRRRHARRADANAIHLDKVVRKPEVQRNETAEDEEVVQREAPYLKVLQRRELLGQCRRACTRGAAGDQCGIILGEEVEHHAHHQKADRPDMRNPVPAKGDHHERRDEGGDGGADVARAKDAKRGALLARAIPARHIGHPDDERATSKADPERRDQIHCVARRPGQHPGRRRRQHHLRREDDPATVFLGQNAQKEPRDRSG